MSERTIEEQIVKYLTDVHSIEEQALPQLRAAPKLAGDPTIARHFETHIGETEQQEQRVRSRLEELGESPAPIKDLAAKVSAPAFVLFAKAQPDTPGKLVSHAYSYEHMEIAAYELLLRVAERGADRQTGEIAKEIAAEEREMAERLAGSWDLSVAASLEAVGRDDLDEQLNKYLADAHAIEAQAIQMLNKAIKIGGEPELGRAYQQHLEETEDQQRRIEKRLEARDGARSLLKDAGMRLGALNWGAFFQAQPDTPAKLAGFAYAFEHLEIAGYEQLRRVAAQAGDEETVEAAESILSQERAAAETLLESFDRALGASLKSLGVAA